MTQMYTTAHDTLDADQILKGYTGYKLCIETCKRSQYIIIKNGSLDVKIKHHVNRDLCEITWLEPIND